MKPGRSGLAAIAVVGAILGIATGTWATAAPGPSGQATLPPDLRPPPPRDLSVTSRGDSRRLRFASTMGNLGPGPLEVGPGAARGRCERKKGRTAYQSVYWDADGNGVFRRSSDGRARRERVGCIRLHPAHDHWHLDAFAQYALAEEPSGTVVARASKVSFCLLDTVRSFPTRPGSPPAGYYGGCTVKSAQGISVGWSDVYDSTLPGQSLDVSGLPEGAYCLGVTADPRNRLTEAREENNVRWRRLRLRRDSASPLPGPCRSEELR